MYNAIEREFNTDVKQKKSIARGAYARKNGSKSKKCSLPSDILTAAQKRKLNGPVQSYAVNRPMSWSAFKSMPADLQQAHLDFMQNAFSASVTAIERDVFNIGACTLRLHCKNHGLLFRATGTHSCDREGLLRWVTGEAVVAETVPTEPEPVEEVAEVRAADTEAPVRSKPFADLRDLPDLFCGGELRLQGRAEDLIPRPVTLIGSNSAWLSVHLSFTDRKDD